MNNKCKNHWESVYGQKNPDEVSWFQSYPRISLELIYASVVNSTSRIIDVGGGASVLIDQLLDKGYENITVLDISAKAIDYAKERLKGNAKKVTWIETDITNFQPAAAYDLWHDWAVFHFLTDSNDRRKYIDVLNNALAPDGHVIISTFDLEGPSKCSGLDVERYNEEKLAKEIGVHFKLIKSINEDHETPWKARQRFMYCYFRKIFD